MLKHLKIIGITLLAALQLAAGIFLIDRYVELPAASILSEDGGNVKQADDVFGKTDARPVNILDAGHGGEDSGAVGIGQVLERISICR